MNFYYFLFYSFYRFARICGATDPGDSALLVLSTFLFFNVMPWSFPLIHGKPSLSSYKIWCLVVAFVILGINSLILRGEEKKKRIVEYYDKKYETKGFGWHRIVLVILYIIGSFVLMYVLHNRYPLNK